MRTLTTRFRGLAVVGVLVALGGCSGPAPSTAPSAASAAPRTFAPTPGSTAMALWPAPPNPLELAIAAGIPPDTREHLANHVHAHLDVFVDGTPVVIPAGVGINIIDPEVRRFDEPGGVIYGGIEECASPCISSLHTHDETGIIHTESEVSEPHTLGEFFIEWDVPFDESCVGEFCDPKPIAVYVNGEPYTGDPREIELTDLKVIVIAIGTPPAEIPSTADFSNA